jgi:hypothetical protein
MGNAEWLFLALPEWFFSALLSPLGAGPLSAIPAAGAVALIVGIVLGVLKREARLLSFAGPFVASQIFVAVSGLMRGRLMNDPAGQFVLAFLLVQLVGCCVLIYWIKGSRLAATSLTAFSVSYALFTAFVATMAFTDSWV